MASNGCTRRSLASLASLAPAELAAKRRFQRTGANWRERSPILPCRRSWVRVPSSALSRRVPSLFFSLPLSLRPRSGGVFNSETGMSGSSNGTLDSPVGSFDRAVRGLAAKPRFAADAETRLHGLVFGSVFPGRPDEHGSNDRQRHKDHDERDDSGGAGHPRECRTDVQAGRPGAC